MATAGRILIMPKGAYNASTTYEMLDLVSHNGTSWLAKKTSVGIEPSKANAEYWHEMFNFNDAVGTKLVAKYPISNFSGEVEVYKSGNVISIYMSKCKATEAIAANTILFTLAEEYRPKIHSYYGSYVRMMINDDTGEVKLVDPIVKDQWLYETLTYVI